MVDGQGATTIQETRTTGEEGTSKRLPIPTTEGHTFLGYYTAANGTAIMVTDNYGQVKMDATGYGSPTILGQWEINVSAASALYARWLVNRYTVTFSMGSENGNPVTDANPSTIAPITNIEYKSIVFTQMPGNPTREAFTFQYWYYLMGGSETQFNAATATITSNLTLIAKWQKKTYTITFNSKGGLGGPTSTTVDHGERIERPVNEPVKDGFKFGGWFTDDYNVSANPIIPPISEWDWAFGRVTSAFTLYAKWTVAEFFIKLVMPEGAIQSNTNLQEDGITYAIKLTQSAQIVRPDNPQLAGFKFDNWFNEPGFSTFVFGTMGTDTLSTTTYSQNVSIYAKFDANTAYLVYQYKDATGNNQRPREVVKTNDKTNLIIPTKTGYTFDGWWTADNNGDMVADKNGQAQPFVGGLTKATLGMWIIDNSEFIADINIYAKWVPNAKSFTYSPGIGNMVGTTVNLLSGDTKNLTVPTAVGFKFNGWWTTASTTSGGIQVTDIDGFVLAGAAEFSLSVAGTWIIQDPKNTYFYARWIANSVTFRYQMNGQDGESTMSGSTTRESGTQVELSTNMKQTGYKWLGWFTQTINGVQITDNNGKPLSTASAFCVQNGTWCIQNIESSFQDVYPQWAPNTRVLVYSVNGGGLPSTASDRKVVETGSAAMLDIPTRTGHQFKGWFTAQQNGTQITGSDGKVRAGLGDPIGLSGNTAGVWLVLNESAGSLTVFAQWEIMKYTIKFNANGGTMLNSITDQIIEHGKLVVKPTDPTRKGYIFGGWFQDNGTFFEEWNFNLHHVTQSMTLHAKWVEEGAQGGGQKPNPEPGDEEGGSGPLSMGVMAAGGGGLLLIILLVVIIMRGGKKNKGGQ
jgi:uncharacterized repeat protein (TIGR02543 family)